MKTNMCVWMCENESVKVCVKYEEHNISPVQVMRSLLNTQHSVEYTFTCAVCEMTSREKDLQVPERDRFICVYILFEQDRSGAAARQLQHLWFDPEIQLLSVWSFLLLPSQWLSTIMCAMLSNGLDSRSGCIPASHSVFPG